MRRWNGWGEEGVEAPLPDRARDLLGQQVGAGTPTTDARLEDVIPLIGKLAGATLADQPGAVAPDTDTLGGLTPDALLAVIDRAVEVCNQLVIYESLATGAKFGLRIEAMATILLGGSAWSKVAERMLPALTAATDVDLPGTLGSARADLRVVTSLAAACDVPLLEANSALSFIEAACNELGEGAPIGKLAGLFERASGVTYASRQTAPG